jgi:hypothetical protein
MNSKLILLLALAAIITLLLLTHTFFPRTAPNQPIVPYPAAYPGKDSFAASDTISKTTPSNHPAPQTMPIPAAAAPPASAPSPPSASDSALDLPTSLTDDDLLKTMSDMSCNQVLQHMDAFVRNYVPYAQLSDQLARELDRDLHYTTLATPDLIQNARLLRDAFWKNGGNFSSKSYIDAYKARVLLELTRQREPNNLMVTDELVETMLSTHPVWTFDNTGKKIQNAELQKALCDLRMTQFQQIKQEVAQGRQPDFQDFARACDLTCLLGSCLEDFAAAQEVVAWQIAHAASGGWNAYLTPLHRQQQDLRQGQNYKFNIFLAAQGKYPAEFQYARRLLAFQGPDIQKRGLAPVHKIIASPVWHSSD